MAVGSPNNISSIVDDPSVREAAEALIEAVGTCLEKRTLNEAAYERTLKEIGRKRGRPLAFPWFLSGEGRGARVRLANGEWKLDFIGGIGVYGFGHRDRDLLIHATVAAARDTVFQGHLMPASEYLQLSKALLRHAGKRLTHCWLSLSGTMANENALKMILQKHAPANRIVAFEGNFCGRSLASSEISDRPQFRDGLPLSGNTLLVPYYDPEDPDSIQKSVTALRQHLQRFPGHVAGMLFELIQGEGGIRPAPREFFQALMEVCQAENIAVWVDEVQTFARTGELFAFRTFGLEEMVDVVTAGKMLQGSATLFSKRYNPKPGLVAGTYAGSTVGMAVGTRIIERLEQDGYLGSEGRVAILARRVERRFQRLREKLPKAVGHNEGIGAMHAFQPFDGTPEQVRAVLEAAFTEGAMLFSAGSPASRVRMLLPVNVTDEELEYGFSALERALIRVAEDMGLTC